MSETILKATERTEDLKKVRAAGLIPGVLNGPGTASTSVKFEKPELRKIIAQHGKNAKVWVELGAVKQFGFIKDIQRHPVEGNILHTVIQLVGTDQEVKMQLPINYQGTAQLEHKLLYVQIHKSELEVYGQADKMPDAISLDISEKGNGDSITAADFQLAPEIKILDPADEIFAVIKAKHETNTEAPKETKEASPAE